MSTYLWKESRVVDLLTNYLSGASKFFEDGILRRPSWFLIPEFLAQKLSMPSGSKIDENYNAVHVLSDTRRQ